MAQHIITTTDEVEAALVKVAVSEGKSVDEVVQEKLSYYIACQLYDYMSPIIPFNTPGLSIQKRLEAYATYVNKGRDAAVTFVESCLKPV